MCLLGKSKIMNIPNVDKFQSLLVEKKSRDELAYHALDQIKLKITKISYGIARRAIDVNFHIPGQCDITRSYIDGKFFVRKKKKL